MKKKNFDNRSKEKNGLITDPQSLTVIQISNASGGFVTMSQAGSTGNEGPIISGAFAEPYENTGEDFKVPVPNASETAYAYLFIGTCSGIYKTYINKSGGVIIKQFQCDGEKHNVYDKPLSEFPNGSVELKVDENGVPSYKAE